MPTDVDQLARRVADLEALLAAQLGPSYAPLSGLKVAPDGKVSYDFDGHVKAKGLDLDAAPSSTFAAENSVRWLAPDGGYRAGIQGDSGGGLTLAGGGLNAGGGNVAELNMGKDNFGGASSVSVVVSDPASQVALLLDELGQSRFLKLGGAVANRRVAFGLDAVTMTAPSSGNRLVTHGLNAPPLCALVSIVDGGSLVTSCTVLVGARTNTQITVTGTVNVAGDFTNGVLNFAWLVIA